MTGAPRAPKRTAPHSGAPEQEWYSLDEACRILNVTRSKMRAILRLGEIRSVKVRGVYRISIADFRRVFHSGPE